VTQESVHLVHPVHVHPPNLSTHPPLLRGGQVDKRTAEQIRMLTGDLTADDRTRTSIGDSAEAGNENRDSGYRPEKTCRERRAINPGPVRESPAHLRGLAAARCNPCPPSWGVWGKRCARVSPPPCSHATGWLLRARLRTVRHSVAPADCVSPVAALTCGYTARGHGVITDGR
jgi:hypothetical protein